jgi:GDPmannose 4,6-dehydratase
LKKNIIDKVALITGITGQDGSYLAQLLLKKGYKSVLGIKRKTSLFNTGRIDHLLQTDNPDSKRFNFFYGDLTDSNSINKIIYETQPDEIYNLGAMSHVRDSFEIPIYTANANGLGVLRILESLRFLGLEQKTKVYQASSSELFGKTTQSFQNEQTPFHPRSPYSVSKLAAYWAIVNYREAYGMFASNGILFNHESPLRGETFVTRKITRALSRIVMGLQKELFLGNINAVRDWGHARDYMEAAHLIMQHHEPLDLVIGTGKISSVREFFLKSCQHLGLTIRFEGKNEDERGYIEAIDHNHLYKSLGFESTFIKVNDCILKINPKYYRPAEVDYLRADCSKAKKLLNWTPVTSLDDLIKEMVDYDVHLMKKSKILKDNGYDSNLFSETKS